jgi:MoxR-like ATPase
MEIKGQITKLLDDLNKGVYEKQEVIALTLLTAVAGESIFLLGAPGVAKSLIARRLKFGFKDGTSFEYLMNRFSTPDEIFGPVSISQLKDHDKYERIIKNYLPSATVVFLDEIWKAGPSIQNALLTVLNEKVYRNGDQEIKVPMKALISASNELPMKGEGLEALWDRFLVRYVVDGITDKDNFNEMISKSLNSYDDNVSAALKLTDDQYNKISAEIDKVEIPENVFNVIHIIRNYLDQHNKKDEKQENQIYISDRRWRKIVRLLRTSAFLNDRKAVDLMDCFLIAHCIWNEQTQFATVLQFTKEAVQKHGYKLEIDLKDLKDEIKEFKNEVDTYTNEVRRVKHKENKIYKLNGENYYRVLELQGKFSYETNDLINQKEIEAAKADTFIQSTRHRKDFQDRDNVSIKKGKSEHSIILSNDGYNNPYEVKIETVDTTKEESFTKKPHHATKKHWDKEVSKYLTITSNLKSQVEHFRKEDLKHLRVNLFVNQDFADLVEANLNETHKGIEKIEVEVNKIRHYYENVEDQSEQQEMKQLTNGKQ